MATIDDLLTKFTDLNQKEAYDFIGNLRAERRIKPESPKAYRKAAKGTREAKAKIKGVSKLTPDQLAKVLTKEQKIRLLREMGVDV